MDMKNFDAKQMRNEKEEQQLMDEYTVLSNNLLNKYGPEGLYKISEIMIKLTDDDISNHIERLAVNSRCRFKYDG